jgi:DNA polymerase III delta prime subunit
MIENNLWVEKYRPHTIDECILPKNLKDYFNAQVKRGEVENMLLIGSSGVGKTTIAKALCEQLETDYIVIDGSTDNGIDIIRNTIISFASSVSLSGKVKVVIIDEADGLNASSTQKSLRNVIEKFSHNCRFIFTCNYVNKIIPALRSRLKNIDFKLRKEDEPRMCASFFKSLKKMLDNENIEFDEEVLVKTIKAHYPDFRRTIIELQGYSSTGELTSGVLSVVPDETVSQLYKILKTKNWHDVRKWVAEYSDMEPHVIFRKLYDQFVDESLKNPGTVKMMEIVWVFADYQDKASRVADQEINTMAAMSELMGLI